MDQAYSKTIILTCTAVALALFIGGAFLLFKNNQVSLNSINNNTFQQLEKELEGAFPGDGE